MEEASDSPVGVTIPGSGLWRKKTYSVSLHDNTFDVSEINAEPQGAADDAKPVFGDVHACSTCGQTLPQKTQKPSAQFAVGSPGSPGSDVTSNRQVSRGLPLHYGTNTQRLDLESVSHSHGNTSNAGGLDHCHSVFVSKPDVKARQRLLVASVLCLFFMIGEIIGGYLANSLAIATDAAHLLTDFASFMISLFSIWLAARPPTKQMSFGWYRAEVIGALISVLMIWVVTGVLVYLAIQRLVYKEFDIDAKVMLITSAVGVGVNLLMGATLHQHGHSHGHNSSHCHGGHSHSIGRDVTDAESEPLLSYNDNSSPAENINVRAAFIHVIGDFVQSLGVLVAAIVIYYKPAWTIIDPICTFLFSFLVLLTTVAILKDALTVLMEGLPRGLDFNIVQNTFLSVDGVLRVHNLRIWALSMEKVALSAHLAVRPGIKTTQVLLQASSLVRRRFNVFEMTLQVEEFEAGMENCTQCQDPLD